MSDPSPAIDGPSAMSVTAEGKPDGWVPTPGYEAQRDDSGSTRLVIVVEPARLAQVHQALVQALSEPLGFLYRQRVDRTNPRPEGAPPRDFVALELETDEVLGAVQRAAPLVYHDARGEVWVRGAHADQVILDHDGTLFCYPYDPLFLDVVAALGLSETSELQTLEGRDYVLHWYHAACDGLEDALIDDLGLSEVPSRS